MAYGSPEDGGGWWSVQRRSIAIASAEAERKRNSGRDQIEILDVGSGPGYTVSEFNKLPGVNAHGLEYNDKMVSYSRQKYGIEVRQGDMHNLSEYYPAESMDVIHAQSVLWASDRPEKVVAEIAKI